MRKSNLNLDVEAVRKLVDMGWKDEQISKRFGAKPFNVRMFRQEHRIMQRNDRGHVADEDIALTPMAQLSPRVQAYLRSKGR